MSSHVIDIAASAIRYECGSIGREISLDVGLAGEMFSCNLRLSPGQTRALNREVVQLWTDGDSFAVSGHIQVTERDAVYSDSGISNVTWTLNFQGSGFLESTNRIEVVEVGGQNEGTSGVFFVTLRAQQIAATRYVQEPETGWLTVLDEAVKRISLPETLSVELYRIAEGREYFIIAEVVDYPLKPWALGTNDIEIPDAPHKGGLRYPESSRFRTWFRVGHSGDRFIHTKAASAGCITVVDRAKWDQVCSILVSGREGDRISVGTIEVKA